MQRITDKRQMDLRPFVCLLDIRDINAGIEDNPRHCPVARALNRRLKARFVCLVTSTHVWVVDRVTGLARFKHRLPDSLQEFVQTFDAGLRTWQARRVRWDLQAPAEVVRTERANWMETKQYHRGFQREGMR